VLTLNKVSLNNNSIKVTIQGVNERLSSHQTKMVIVYGTDIVCGIIPKKEGQKTYDMPVYDTTAEAKGKHDNFVVLTIFIPSIESCTEDIGSFIKLKALSMANIDVEKLIDYVGNNEVKIVGIEATRIFIPV